MHCVPLIIAHDDGQMMLVLPIDNVDCYKKRDRFIVQVKKQNAKKNVECLSQWSI
jgi:hypothetical protein